MTTPAQAVDVPTRLAKAQQMISTDPEYAETELLGVVADSDGAEGARAAYSLARIALVGARLTEALDWIDVAANSFLRCGLDTEAARTDLGRINILNDLGRHHEAVEVGAKLLASLTTDLTNDGRGNSEEGQWLTAAVSENIGVSYGRLGEHGRALEYYDQAGLIYLTVGQPTDRARVAGNRGVENLEMGNHSDALAQLTWASSKFEEVGDKVSAGRCETHLGKVHALAGAFGKALASLENAETHLEHLAESQDQMRTDLVRAEVLSALNLTNESLELCERLVIAFDDHGMIRDAGLALLTQASVLALNGSTPAAIKCCEEAEERFSKARVPSLLARGWLLRSDLTDTSDALELAAAAGQFFQESGHASFAAAAALRQAELSPGTTAAPHLAQAQALIDEFDLRALSWRLEFQKGVLAEYGCQPEDALCHYQRSLVGLSELRSSIPADVLRVRFMERRRASQEACVRLNLDLGRVSSALRVTGDERANSLAERLGIDQSDLPEDRCNFVTFQTLDSRIVAFVEGPEFKAPLLVELSAGTAEIATQIRNLDVHMRRCADSRMRLHLHTLEVAARKLLQRLYLSVFEPIAALVDSAEPLVIVPSGAVANVPFHALHDGVSYMAERFSISTAPNADIARHLNAPKYPSTTLVVGVADLYAPRIQDEALRVGELTGGEVLLNGAATAVRVRTAVQGIDVVHFACHGNFRSDNPLGSALQLGDGWITANEISTWDLSGSLVVLASCNSGRQVGLSGGDELQGIPRAFLCAGASAVVMNMWPADDEHTLGLMTSFHRNLRSESAASALRHSQIDAIQRSNHPYHWAPTVLYGSSGTQVFSENEHDKIQ